MRETVKFEARGANLHDCRHNAMAMLADFLGGDPVVIDEDALTIDYTIAVYDSTPYSVTRHVEWAAAVAYRIDD